MKFLTLLAYVQNFYYFCTDFCAYALNIRKHITNKNYTLRSKNYKIIVYCKKSFKIIQNSGRLILNGELNELSELKELKELNELNELDELNELLRSITINTKY